MPELINPALCRVLEQLYGKVNVVSPGKPGDYTRKTKVVHKADREVTYVNYDLNPGGERGERYQIRCPFCADHKPRMYISYLFGHRDKETGRVNFHGVKCFNEDCEEDFENLRMLYEETSSLLELGVSGSSMSSSPKFTVEGDEILHERPACGRPGLCTLFSQIQEGTRDFEAIKYVRDERGFDPFILESRYGVEYLKQSYTYEMLTGRVFVPLFRNSQMVAWTARRIPKLNPFDDANHLHSPGGLGGLLYGLGGAVRSTVAVVVEGPFDKWAVGRPALALLSKKLGSQKIARLRSALAMSMPQAIVVLLDPKQSEMDRKKGHQHQIVETAERIRQFYPGPVIPVFLPLSVDPGDCQGTYLSHYLYAAMRHHGLTQLGEILARDVLSSTASWHGYTGARAV